MVPPSLFSTLSEAVVQQVVTTNVVFPPVAKYRKLCDWILSDSDWYWMNRGSNTVETVHCTVSTDHNSASSYSHIIALFLYFCGRFEWIGKMFNCVPFALNGWGVVILLAATVIPVDLIRKSLLKKK